MTDIASKFRRALSAVGFQIKSSADEVDTASPSLTSGAGAPSASEPDGSVYLRTDGGAATTVYARVSGAWVAIGTADAELTALAGLTSAANKLPYFTGSGTADVADFTAYGRSVVAVADEAAFKALVNLEIGTDVQAVVTGLSADHLVRATVAAADVTGGGTGSALTLQLHRLDGTTPIASARQGLIIVTANPYTPFESPDASCTFGSATTGTIVSSATGWCLFETDAAGAFACTLSNSQDETRSIRVITAQGGSDTSKGCLVVASNVDSATWSA